MRNVRLLTALLLAFAAGLAGSELRPITPAGFKPTGRPFNPAIQAGHTLYLSGQGTLDATGKEPENFEAAVRQCLANTRAILQAAGMDFKNVVWMNIYLPDLRNVALMNQVYWNAIGDRAPARTVLGVSALPGGAPIEINCIAVDDTQPRREIWPSGWKKGPGMNPPGVLAGDVLYLSAQDDRDPDTGKAAGAFPDRVKQSLENVNAILKAAGMSYANVLWVNPYMGVGGKYQAMNKVYASCFEFGNTPGRGTIQVASLPDDAQMVFSCIAGADLSKRKAVRPRNMPPSPTASPGVLYGDTLYLSAKDGFIPGQGIVTQDFDLQLRQTMRNLLDGLEEADMDLSNVAWATVYLKSIVDYDAMNTTYAKFFKNYFPARTTLQQNSDPQTDAREQISVIAVQSQKH
jgi:reactive intermediate/imine deaminase